MASAFEWPKTTITRENGEEASARQPVIVSASRSTDIPTYYADWFFHRLKVGYSAWTNPFNNRRHYIDYSKTRFIVFWSKQPRPMLRYIRDGVLRERGIDCYLQYTLNDYEDCGLNIRIPDLVNPGIHVPAKGMESNLAPLSSRIETFIQYSELLGKDRVIWRFDPLFLLKTVGPDDLLKRIEHVGDRVAPYTRKLVFSFADIGSVYPAVQRNLDRLGIKYLEWTEGQMHDVASGIQKLNDKWGLELATCGEPIDLSHYGIKHNHCIDEDLIIRLAYKDKEVMDFLRVGIRPRPGNFLGTSDELAEGQIDLGNGFLAQKHLKKRGNQSSLISYKDAGQRASCGCTYAKDIGEYGTCLNACHYCYANGCMNWETLVNNWKQHSANRFGETIKGR